MIVWLKVPPRVFLIVLYIVTAAAATGAVLLTTLGDMSHPLDFVAYVLYAFSAITFGYSVYTVVRLVPNIKRGVIRRLRKYRFTRRLLEQYGFRTVVFSVGSFLISLLYVVFNGVIGIADRSIWYGALAAYYLLLVAMRGGVLRFHRLKKKRAESTSEQKKRGIKIYRRCGYGLVVLPLCLSFAILQMVRGVNSFEHAGMMIYVSASYAFYKIVMSVVHILKARTTDDMTVRAIRSINLADAMVSVLALQTAMFKEFGGNMNAGLMNAVTGGVVCTLTAGLGIWMILRSNSDLKRLYEGTEDEGR